MCVIMVATGTRPDDEMITRAFEHNDHGAGIAWREQDAGETFVNWKKGLKLDEIKDLCRKLPLPYVAHFRIASIGPKLATLTHPFPVSPDAELSLYGRTRGYVLFHNGTWSPWADKALDAAIAAKVPIPTGNWSDSRAMAWMVNIFGPGFMELLPDQKGVLFSPEKLDVFTGRGWTKVNDVWCSNDFFVPSKGHGRSHNHNKVCSRGSCAKTAMYNNSLCYDCDKEVKELAARSAFNTPPKSEEKPLASVNNTPVGGVLSPPGKIMPGPVELIMGGKDRPLAETLTLIEVERLVKLGNCSQKKLKKFRQYYSDLGRGKNKRERAIQNLKKLSETVVEALIQSGNGLEA